MINEKRYALLVGNSASFVGENEREIPSEIVSKSLNILRQRLASLGSFSFGWPLSDTQRSDQPQVLKNSSYSKFVQILEELRVNVDNDTLFLLYYFGHGAVHEGELKIAFGTSGIKQADGRTLSQIIDEIYHIGVRKLMLITDHCHAGFTRKQFELSEFRLQYYLMAASQSGYTYYNDYGGLWTVALSEGLENWNWGRAFDPNLGYCTFARWFESARQKAEDKYGLSPYSLDGGLENHPLLSLEHSIDSGVIGHRTERTIYNRLYLLLNIIGNGSCDSTTILNQIEAEKWRVFLIASGSEQGEKDRYISPETIDWYLRNASAWGLVSSNIDINPQYKLNTRGKQAIANKGNQYNQILHDSIYEYLNEFDITKEFLESTIRKIIRSFDVPDVNAIMRQVQYELGVLNLDHTALEFALRILSQAGDLQKNTGHVFFPFNPATLGD